MSSYPSPTPERDPSRPARSHACAWCGAVSDGTQLACPACGAPLDTRAITTQSGWVKAPGRKDMAKLQFGQSFCQIEGAYVPVAEMSLAGADGVYFAHHVLLWKDREVQVGAMSLKGAWKRMFAGLPLVMTQAKGPGHIAFSRDAPGEMVALPIQPGRAVDVREHVFVVATGQVAYDWYPTNVWFSTGSGNEKETHYPLGMYMDRFSAQGSPGLLILHASGNLFVRELAPRQAILVKPTALLFKDPSVSMQLHFEHPRTTVRSWRAWGERYLWLTLFGPGRVAVQSAFEPVEDDGKSISDHSDASRQQW